MKVLFITRKFPPSVGGMELFAHDLYEALDNKIETKLVKWGGSNIYLPLVIPSMALQASWALLKHDIDVIHVHDGVLAPVGWMLSKLFNRPFTVQIHGLDITHKNKVFQSVIPRFVKRADSIFCISQAAADEVIKRGGNPEKITIIPLAVSDTIFGTSSRKKLEELYEIQPEQKVLITVGRLVKRKGVSWFIENVLPSLVKDNPELVYFIVGEGSERPAIEAVIEKTALNENVRLLGRLDEEDRAAVYNGADIFVMPNIPVDDDIEGFGLVLLEASLCKLPVVAANLEGIKDAVSDGKNGILVPTKDAKAFKTEIEKLLNDEKYAANFGSSSREFTMKNYQWDKLSDMYVEQYKKNLK